MRILGDRAPGLLNAAAGAPRSGAGQPRVKGNDWRGLRPPQLGFWEPTRTVTVVVPAYNAHRTLPFTLASLAAQSYPSHLIETIVVDDGSGPALQLPTVRPDNCRIERTTRTWGRAGACGHGADLADGEVIHWLDADMLVDRQHIEAQMRWHHVIDYAAVLGQKTFVDPRDGLPTVTAAWQAVAHDRTAELFAGDRWRAPHVWIETKYASTDLLTKSPFRAYRAHVGATASVSRELYRTCGGMDSTLKLGEDIELGYRLAQRGAVFVPELRATAWHLGVPNVVTRQAEVNAHNRPYIANRVSDFRAFRKAQRSYLVPHVEVVVETAGKSFDEVAYTADALLATRPHDLRVVLRGSWPGELDVRANRLDDPGRDRWMLHAEYAGEPRVRFAHDVPASAFPTMLRLHLPAGWAPGSGGLLPLLRWSDEHETSVSVVRLPDGGVVRLERTGMVERALRLRAPSERLDDVLAEVGGVGDATSRLAHTFVQLNGRPAPPARGDRHRPLALGLTGYSRR